MCCCEMRDEKGGNILLSTGTDNRTGPVTLGHNVRHILTLHLRPQVPKVLDRVAARMRLGDVVHGEPLIVGERVHERAVQEARAVDGGVEVERLDGDVILVGDARVVHVDEAVGGAGEEDGGRGRVVGQGGDVVGVQVVVGGLGGW